MSPGVCCLAFEIKIFVRVYLEDGINRLKRVLLIVYLLEAGLVLVLAPWSVFWEQNVFVELFPLFGRGICLPAIRGAVSGIGLVSLCAGLWELVSLVGVAVSRVSLFGGRASGTEPLV
jgi:hypothetical protein